MREDQRECGGKGTTLHDSTREHGALRLGTAVSSCKKQQSKTLAPLSPLLKSAVRSVG